MLRQCRLVAISPTKLRGIFHQRAAPQLTVTRMFRCSVFSTCPAVHNPSLCPICRAFDSQCLHRIPVYAKNIQECCCFSFSHMTEQSPTVLQPCQPTIYNLVLAPFASARNSSFICVYVIDFNNFCSPFRQF